MNAMHREYFVIKLGKVTGWCVRVRVGPWHLEAYEVTCEVDLVPEQLNRRRFMHKVQYG